MWQLVRIRRGHEDERMFFRERLEQPGAPLAAVHADRAIAEIVGSFFCVSE
jgi:hypothetical protein